MGETIRKGYIIIYLFVVCLIAYWFSRRLFLTTNVQIGYLLVSTILFVLGAFAHWCCERSPVRRRRIYKTALWILFGYYLYILLELLFLGNLFLLSRDLGGGGRMNLIPFRTIHAYASLFRNYPNVASITNILGNLVVFMPMGVLLPLLFSAMRRWYLFFPFMAVLLVGVEVLQNVTDRGRADVDDVILNFAGAAVVYIIWGILSFVVSLFTPRCNHS